MGNSKCDLQSSDVTWVRWSMVRW